MLISALLLTARAGAGTLAVAGYTPRGREIFREETHIELARDYERTFVWKRAAYELQFEFGPEGLPVGLLVFMHPHARAPRPYTVTLQVGGFGGPLLPGDEAEILLVEGDLTFKVWHLED